MEPKPLLEAKAEGLLEVVLIESLDQSIELLMCLKSSERKVVTW